MTDEKKETVLPQPAMEWITLALMAWIGATTFQTAKDVAVLKTQLESATVDRYHKAEAVAAHDALESRVARLEKFHEKSLD